jgi:hypothetical protein
MHIRVKKDEQDDKAAIEVLVSSNGSVSLQTLALTFPEVTNLKYWNSQTSDYKM